MKPYRVTRIQRAVAQEETLEASTLAPKRQAGEISGCVRYEPTHPNSPARTTKPSNNGGLNQQTVQPSAVTKLEGYAWRPSRTEKTARVCIRSNRHTLAA